MTLKKLKELLETTGYPVTYRAWPEKKAPPLPFVCYLVSYTENVFADSSVYTQVNHVQIELYTQTKDIAAEDKVEKALSSFTWDKTETYIESEKMYQIMYEIEV